MSLNPFSMQLDPDRFYCTAFTCRRDADEFADQLREENAADNTPGTVMVQRRTFNIKDAHNNKQKTTIWFVVA